MRRVWSEMAPRAFKSSLESHLKAGGAGRRRTHRLRVPEHNSGNEVEAKGTDFFALVPPLALKLPQYMCGV